MSQQTQIQALQQEVAALRRENQELRKTRLRIYVERAVFDDEMSRNLVGMLGDLFPAPPTPWYVCILFYGIRTQGQEFPTEDPLSVIERYYTGPLSRFGQTCFFDASGSVACLLNISAAYSTPPGQEFLRVLRDQLSAVYDISADTARIAYIAVSRPSRMESGPKPLYRGALSASEHRTADSPPVCLEPPAEVPDRRDHYQLMSLEQTFWRQIQARNFYDAAGTLDQMIQFSQQERGALDKTLAAVFYHMELALNVTLPRQDLAEDTPGEFQALLGRLSQVKRYEEMREAAYDILATLEDRLYAPVDSRNRKMPAIEQHIRTHYSDQNLGANSIAETFKISPSYLSRIFKSDTGAGIVEYIHNIRVEAAKGLLSDTDLTMDAIAVAVGFSSRVVLNRVFKAHTGMTPGVYRSSLRHTGV